MEAEIRTIGEKKLVGKKIRTSLAENRTVELWQSFMPGKKEISHVASADLFSVQVFPMIDFSAFNNDTPFEKWAAVEVTDFGTVPQGMETFILPEGLYAVFVHKGPASAFGRTSQYIYGSWFPASDYVLDNRPHLGVMGEKYKNEHPDSEEEIWIPVKLKSA